MPVFLALAVALTWYAREMAAQSRLNDRTAKLRTQGYPVDNASVQTYYTDQTDATNTDAWLAILEFLNSYEFNGSIKANPRLPYLGYGMDMEDHVPSQGDWADEDSVRDFLKQWKRLHTDITQLASASPNQKPVRLPIVFDGFKTLLPWIQEKRTIARLLSLYGSVALRDRDSAAVRAAIESILGTNQIIAGEPNLVAQLVSIAVDSHAILLLQQAIEQDALNAFDLESLLPKIMAATTIGDEWVAMLAGERGMALPGFRNPSDAGFDSPIALSRYVDANCYLDIMQSFQQIERSDLDEFLIQLKKCESAAWASMNSGWLAKMDSALTSQAVPSISAVGEAFVRRAVSHRLAAQGIGLRLYEDRHGTLPESLNQLTEFSLDPTQLMPPGGKPFGYRVDGKTATLWGFDPSRGIDLRTSESVPIDPPVTSKDQPDASENDQWVWNLK
jgi:hypothetical protein